MILGVQQALEAALVGAAMTANVAAVNAKYVAGGITITVPAVGNIYTYENETTRWDNDQTAVFVIPQGSALEPYQASGKIRISHDLLLAFVLRDQSPATLAKRKLMIAEAAVPTINAVVRNGAERYNGYVERIEYQPQFAEGPYRISDVTCRVVVNEFIPSESVG